MSELMNNDLLGEFNYNDRNFDQFGTISTNLTQFRRFG